MNKCLGGGGYYNIIMKTACNVCPYYAYVYKFFPYNKLEQVQGHKDD